MAQGSIVAAFRGRLKRVGYYDIHIKKDCNGLYIVTAREPLAGCKISCVWSEVDMYRLLH